MKTLLIFLACLLPSTTFLWLAGTDDAGSARLPDRAPPADEPAVLAGSDLADQYGEAPFAGKLRRLRDFSVRVVEKNYVKLYLALGRLARHDDEPRLEEVSGAVFDPPQDGRPRLRLTLHSPYVSGDLAALVHDRDAAPRIATLYGGVAVRDAQGRLLAEVASLRVDVKQRTVQSDDAVTLRLPDEGVEVRATGLFGDLELRRARLEKDVTATVSKKDQRATLSCAGPATVRDLPESKELVVTLQERARIAHAFGVATCQRLVAEIRSGDKEAPLKRATLLGEVSVRLDAASARGLQSVSMPRLVIDGGERLICDGPVIAVWRGRVTALGLGERTLDLEAGNALILLRKNERSKMELEEARFSGGVRGKDRDGPGRLQARVLTLVSEGGVLEATGDVRLVSPDGSLRAERLLFRRPAADVHELDLKGEKEISYVADGKLGPLGEGTRGTLHLTSKGAMRVRARGDEITFHATDEVVARIDERSRLVAGDVTVVAKAGKLVSFEAKRGVEVWDKGRGASVKGETFSYVDGVARIEGAPAAVALADGQRVEAKVLVYRDDRTFAAEGDVVVAAVLARGEKKEPWTIHCGAADGELAKEGLPRSIRAKRNVVAAGPGGQRIEGDTFSFDGETGEAQLAGTPALVLRGSDLRVTSLGFDLVVKDNDIVSARSHIDSVIDYRPPKEEKGDLASFRRWHIELYGSAVLEGLTLTVVDGARLEAFGAKDAPALKASAGRVEIQLARTKGRVSVKRLKGSDGVVIERLGKDAAKVTAERLDFGAGTRRVDILGNAQVEAEGWPREVRFERLVFVLTKDGIDLQRASRVKIGDK